MDSEVCTYVAPATANSTVLAFVSRDNNITKVLAAMAMIASLAFKLLTALQTITGIRTSNIMKGAIIARVVLLVKVRERIWT